MIYKNEEVGLLAERNGNVIFDNFTISDNRCGGMEFWKCDLTKDYCIVRNSAIIGLSASNEDQDSTNQFKCDTFRGRFKGILTPRSDGLLVENLNFYNITGSMNMITTCAECNNPCVFINSARESVWKNTNVDPSCTTTNKFFMLGHKKEMIYDLDSSLHNTGGFSSTNNTGLTTITNGWPHITQHSACSLTSSSAWNNAAACDSSAIVRRAQFAAMQKATEFDKVDMKIYQVSTPTENVATDLNASEYTSIVSYLGTLEPSDRGKSWSVPYVTGSMYNIWWLTGLDFTHMELVGSKYMTDGEPGIIMRINYT